MTLMIVVFVFLFLLSAFFSGSETAIFSLDLLQRTRLFKSRRPAARRLKYLYQHPRKLLMTILAGNMLVNIALSSLASDLFKGDKLLAIGIITMSLLIFGEVTPKNISYAFNRQISVFNSGLLLLIHRILNPVRRLLDILTGPFIRRYSKDDEKQQLITPEEIKTAVVYGHKQGVLDKDESGLISNVLNFSIKDARHIMTPRTRIQALPVKTSLKDAIAFAKQVGLSKIPLYKKNKDHIVGYLRSRDLLPYIRGQKKATGISHLIYPAFYIPEGKGLAEFFTELKKSTSRLAVVLDEYGGTAGIITLDDVLEEILGQFIDEDEKAEHFFWKTDAGTHIFLGSAPLEVFNQELKMDIRSSDYETLGGYILFLAGNIPAEGDVFDDGTLQYAIRKMDDTLIQSVEVTFK